jgi:large subunit ribosomal protein L23
MAQSSRIVIKPVLTEKSSAAYEQAKVYTFQVVRTASKPAIRQAVQQMFKVVVTDVRTINVRAKERRPGGLGRGRTGRRAAWKKAYVTLREGDTIPIFEG